MLLEQVGVGVAYIDELESVLDGDFAPAGQVVHQKLHQVEEVAWLQASFVKNATLVHQREFVLVDLAVQILVHLPNPLVDFWLVVGEAQLSQNTDHVFLVDS